MSETPAFQNFKNQIGEGNATSSRRAYTLDEDLGILSLINQEMPFKKIAELTKRPIASLRYRFADKNRGALKLILQDPTGAALYSYHKVAFTDESDALARVEAYRASLDLGESAAS